MGRLYWGTWEIEKLEDDVKRTRLALLLVFGMLAALLPLGALPAAAADTPVFINEIHYDNTSTDSGEAIEVAGPAGTDLTGWIVALYNGSATQLNVYDTITLAGTIPDQQVGFGTLSFPRLGIQNGSPDGLALVDQGSNVIQFLSYEGSFTAVDGPAIGLTSFDIGVSESGSGPVDESLQLTGTGTTYEDFTWTASQLNTFGAVNTGQTFDVASGPADPVINEFVANHTGSDTHEFVEVFGDPDTDYSTYTVLQLEGDSSSGSPAGVIDSVIGVGTSDASGFWVTPYLANELENGTMTLLLVESFSGSDGDDLDTNDDGSFDATPWTRLVDAVAIADGGGSDVVYSAVVFGPNFDGTPFTPGGASRFPDGTSSWVRNDFDLAGIPGFTGTLGPDEALNTPGAPNEVYVAPPEACGDPFTPIYDVQGSGAASPLVGTEVAIEGVVVGDFQNNASLDNGDLNGFHVQDPTGDGDPATSDGVFVYAPGGMDVSVGDAVRVRGAVSEYNGLTEVTAGQIWSCSTENSLPPAANLSLPVTNLDDFEPFEGMSVTFPQPLVISEYFNFDRYGEIVLTSERHLTPTAEFEPGSPSIDAAAAFLLDRITLDDGRTNQNPDPAMHPNGGVFDLTNLFRGGDTVANVTGVMDYAFNLYRIQPTQGADYTNVNPRTAAPDAVGGTLKVATSNVLNYFTTLDDSGPICGPIGGQDCRGADDANELTRQRDKIIAALTAIDADVVGLMEIENHPGDVPTADLVSGLNDVLGAGTYDYIATGAVGSDAIRQAIIYKPASVTPVGAYAVLDTSVDPRFLDDYNRPVIAQTFMDNATGGVFTVAVNHLKSKGSDCDAIGDPDLGDGQGNCNLTRKAAAEALVDWLAGDPTGSGDGDFLIIGDLNSYDKEDPIDVLKAGGYADLLFQFVGEGAYSYLFDGQIGHLDYQMANASLTGQVRGATVWHINADEPDLIDYDTSFKQDAQDAIYAPDAYRASDHDPVIVGLELTATPKQAKAHALTALSSVLPTGSRYYDKLINHAIGSIEDSLNPAYWVDDTHLTDKGNKVFDEEKKAVKDLLRVRGTAEAGVRVVIAALVGADETLAGTAIADAIALGGSERYIAKAQAEMEKAEYDLARRSYDKAIDHYKKAWEYAQKALEEIPVRFATYNASLNRFNAGDLIADLSTPNNAQAQTVAEIIQRNRPDVLLVNEFDYDAGGVAAQLFQDNYLSISQNGANPIVYPYRYVAPSNTGVPSGFDLDNSGDVGGPNDAFGFGYFEGQYAFVVYSKYPIDQKRIRTFQEFLWKDMPGNLIPAGFFDPDELNVLRLSSKNHVDVPIRVKGETIHFLVSHPTPPVFDGPEDRNGTRNYDEIRFWADYVTGGWTARYIYDDGGKKGGLSRGDKFVIAGDQNSDPLDGDSIPGSAQLLLDHPRINSSMTPSSLGGPEQALLQGGANGSHLSDPAFDTADFSDSDPGNLRADYVLPRDDMRIVASGVFWPLESDPLFRLVGTFPFPSSDHKLVWVDLDLDGRHSDDDDHWKR
jgi:hypothetical protein